MRLLGPAAFLIIATTVGPATADDGADLYQTHCASCHGVEGRGDGPAATALTPPPTNLTKSKMAVAELMKVIDGRRTIRAHGNAAMPVWGRRFEEALGGTGREHRDALATVHILAEYVRKLEATGGTAPAK
jgi:mono/diheme cytochrome c family protein